MRLWTQELAKKMPSFGLTRMEGGAGFPISNLLREYFSEYGSRILTHGPHSFPSSFNVIESFLKYSHDFLMFDLREEREHLLRLQDYLEWYTSGAIPEEPEILVEVMTEGVVHSFNLVDPTGDYRVQTQGSELVISGVALVRHGTELSMMILCGESPSDFSDEEAPDFDRGQAIVGRESLESDPELTAEDRFLKEIPGHSRVIGLVRLDLRGRQSFVRYLNHDVGPRYQVATDDPTVFSEDIEQAQRKTILSASAETLARYEPLFASLWSLIYLPVFFVDAHSRVTETTFSTGLHAKRASTAVRRATRQLGREQLCFSRRVYCLQGGEPESADKEMTVVPPEMEIAESGFWKLLPPGDVGEDEEGNAIVGKTWVERTDTWSTHGVGEFVVRRHGIAVEGANPGYLYIMRSGSHGLDVYKIGKTRRSTDVRAGELTGATGVPTSFEVLASWEVGDINLAEKEAHHCLRAYRLSRRREFFRAPLSTIVAEIGRIVGNLS
ncbi:MAG: GIY-YIG nuclease family protein [Bryobacterales bacterium]|nr:GIY-YIG nuclease family protein [Bryobacterales bacterium]